MMTTGLPFALEPPRQAPESADFTHSQYLGYVFGCGRCNRFDLPITASRYLGTLQQKPFKGIRDLVICSRLFLRGFVTIVNGLPTALGGCS